MIRRARRAFSLMEMVVATAIIAAAATVLLELAGVGWRHAGSATDLAAAQRIAQDILNELLAGARPLQAAEQSPVDGEPDWVYSLTIDHVESPLQNPGLAALRIDVFRQADVEQPQPLPVYTLTRWIRDAQPAADDWASPPPDDQLDNDAFRPEPGL